MIDGVNVLARESVLLQPLPQNVRRARRTVVDTLVSADRADLADTAALVTSEIVTNAVLHAASDIWLTITVTDDGALVEVEDYSAHLPSPRPYDAVATTGRGMSLVDALVSGFGVRPVGSGGKVVWFTLGAAGPGPPAAAFARHTPAAVVRLLHVPVALYCTFQQMADGLLRELALGRLHEGHGASGLDDWNQATEAFGELADAGVAAFAQRDRGVSHVDLVFGVGRDAAARFASLRLVLDQAVSMAAAGLLLAPPSQPEIVGLRNWCCEQVKLQLADRPATRWERSHHVDVPSPAPVDWDPAAVTGSELAMLASDDANRILAVSESAAALLGWVAAELIGQRIVTIVPEGQRDAHVAGFVRYLITGERRILDSPVQVDALRRDGTEVPVMLVISVVRLAGGRAVFTATLTPVS